MKRWKNGTPATIITNNSNTEDKSSDSEKSKDKEKQPGAKFYANYLNKSISDLENEDDNDYDFGGVIGSASLILYLPLGIYALNFSCTGDYCLNYETLSEFPHFVFCKYPLLLVESFNLIKHLEAIGLLLSWWFLQAFLALLLPGKSVHGPRLPCGGQNVYKLNGHRAYLVTLLLVGMFHKKLPLLLDYYMELMTGSIFLATVLSIFLYFHSFRKDNGLVVLSPNVANSKSKIYDFFIGRELNPKICGLDLKFFCELRPGLLLWSLLNLAMLLKELELYGSVSPQMILINVFQGLFVWDAFWNEESILSTLDIMHDGFGYMLAMGDLAWLPFTYGLHAKYLLLYRESIEPMSYGFLTFICFLKITGFGLLRLANNEKHKFRHGQLKNYAFILTKRNNSRLLVSGWWGRARKINYTGDFLQGLSWCLLTGTKCWTPYFYVVYLFLLLRDRGKRDDKICYKKYGNDWLYYKKLVPYKYVPDLF